MTERRFALKALPVQREGHWVGDVDLSVAGESVTFDGAYLDGANAKRSARRSIWFGLAFIAILLVAITGVMVVAVLADIHLRLLGKALALIFFVGVAGTLFEWVGKKAGPEFERKHARILSIGCPRSTVTEARNRFGRDVRLTAAVDPELPGKPKRLLFRAKTKEEATALVEALTAPAAPARPPTKVCPDCVEDVEAAAAVCEYCGHRFDRAGTYAGIPG